MENLSKHPENFRQAWVDELAEMVLASIADPALRAEDLADKMFLSRSQFHRKVLEYTGKPPGSFIREIRLLEARKMLELETFPTVKEVAYRVGYRRIDYFSKIFSERFGQLPSQVTGPR